MERDKPIVVTSFRTGKLKPYGKLNEIEKHAKALAEVWSRIKDMTQASEHETRSITARSWDN